MSFSVSLAIGYATLEAPACTASRVCAPAPVFAAFDAWAWALRRSSGGRRRALNGARCLRRVRPPGHPGAARAAVAQRRLARAGDAALGRYSARPRRRDDLLRAARG